MIRRRFITAVVGCLLVVVVAAGSMLGPGLRHSHSGGEHMHVHDAAGDHAHSHSHAHPHTHGERHSHNAFDSIGPAPVAHVHYVFFGFEWTMPEFITGSEKTFASSGLTETGARVVGGSNVDGRWTTSGSPWLNLLFLGGGPLTKSPVLILCEESERLAERCCHLQGRFRDAPVVPPPQWC